VVLPSQYPPVYREDNETADFFGTIVSDPYRWLENTDSNETTACAHSAGFPMTALLYRFAVSRDAKVHHHAFENLLATRLNSMTPMSCVCSCGSSE
jgi:hypothetical protein